MTADFRPVIKRPAAVAVTPAPTPVPDVMAVLLQQLAAQRKEDGPRPVRWEFIPERDADLLITKITATPFY